jgi:hypothetical protein
MVMVITARSSVMIGLACGGEDKAGIADPNALE